MDLDGETKETSLALGADAAWPPADDMAALRALAESVPMIAFIISARGEIEYVNRRWHDFAGEPPDGGFINPLARFHPDDFAWVRRRWDSGEYWTEAHDIRYRVRGKDESYHTFHVRAEPLRVANGVITRWLGAAVDVTDLVHAGEQASRMAEDLDARVAERTRSLADAALALKAEIARREAMQAELLQTQKLEALGQLTGGVAHDFNNVLGAIVGSYTLIRRRTDDQKVLEIVRHGEEAAERASRLVKQMLAFARRQKLVPEVIDVAALLRSTAELIRPALGMQTACTLSLPTRLWAVLADPRHLETALLNVALNARDAMEDGGTVVISARNLSPTELPPDLPSDSYVAIAVQDTGAGMPPEVLKRATEPFFTTKQPGRGTGLGLSMVHGFARQSGGTLHIESHVGIGTRVEIILPRAAVTAHAADTPAPAGPAPAPAVAGSILFVEDDDQVRPVTAALLEAMGYTVTQATSSEAAMAVLHAMPRCDLLLTDINLPGADGIELARRIRTELPGLPVLFITGRHPPAELAPNDVLLKPFSGAELSNAVAARLGHLPVGRREPPARLLARLGHPHLRALCIAWYAACDPGAKLPMPGSLAVAASGLERHMLLVNVAAGPPMRFRYTQVGAELLALLPHEPGLAENATAEVDHRLIGSLADAWRRCCDTEAPVHQAFNYDLGDGAPLNVQRLVLPLGSAQGAVTHLLVVAVLNNAAREPAMPCPAQADKRCRPHPPPRPSQASGRMAAQTS